MGPNICQCGATAGYPHKEDCPYPFFGDYEEGVEKWEAAHANRVFQMKYGVDPEVVRYARENEFWDLVVDGSPVDLPDVVTERLEPANTGLQADGRVCPDCGANIPDGGSCFYCETYPVSPAAKS